MKKLATQTLATLVIIGVMSMGAMNMSTKRQDAVDAKYLRELDRVYQAHDRRFELRASVLGIEPVELRDQLKDKSLDTVVKKYGFKNISAFYVAVTGKLKTELRQRGWSERKLENYIAKRFERVANSFTPAPIPAV